MTDVPFKYDPENPDYFTTATTVVNNTTRQDLPQRVVDSYKYYLKDDAGSPGYQWADWFLNSAKPGDVYDNSKSGLTGDIGVSTLFKGYNAFGSPVLQTQESDARRNWRGAVSGDPNSFNESISSLAKIGYDYPMARFLFSRVHGWGPVLAAESKVSSPHLEQMAKQRDTMVQQLIDGGADPARILQLAQLQFPSLYLYESQSGKKMGSVASNFSGVGMNPSTLTSAVYGSGGDATTEAVVGGGSGFLTNSGGYDSKGNKMANGAFDAQGNYVGTAGMSVADRNERQSAWSILDAEFQRYGLGALVKDLKDIIMSGANDAEMMLKLRQSETYKNRFAGNEARIKNGLTALSEADYLGLEDQYSRVMRAYGLPDWYTEQGVNGRQGNLEKFIANDVSAAELEDRIQLAVNRVQNGPKEVMETLQKFYPNIGQGELLAYVLDPKKALPVLQRQVQAAEIGGEAARYGLKAELPRAEQLASMGISTAQARQAYQNIGAGLQRGSELSGIYQQPTYDQNTAEQEVFGLENATDATKRRRKLVNMEQATFGGSSGVRGGALEANRAGNF